MNIFEAVSRSKVRFDSPNGLLTTEDLWDLPLTHLNKARANLDDIGIALVKQIQEASTGSLVKKVTRTNEILSLKLEIVKHIIAVKQEAAEHAETLKANQEKKAELQRLIASKKGEALANLPLEKLEEMEKAL